VLVDMLDISIPMVAKLKVTTFLTVRVAVVLVYSNTNKDVFRAAKLMH